MNMRTPDIREFIVDNWQPLALYGGLFAFLAILLIARLNTLLPGYSTTALDTYQAGVSLHAILQSPVDAPFLLLSHGVSRLHTGHSLLLMRLVAAGIGLATLAIFCGLLRYWHDARTALFGTLLLGCSSWFLQTARSGTPEILGFGLFALIACGVWLRASGSPLAVISGLVVAALLVYSPGMVWLIGLGMIWQWGALDRAFKKHLGSVTLAALLFLAIVAPLVWSVAHHLGIAKELLNLPAQGWPTPVSIARSLLEIPLHIFIKGGGDTLSLVRQLPILDVFGSVMFLLGAYVYLTHLGLRRSKLLIAIFAVSAGMLSLGGKADLGILTPFLYLVVAVGVSYLLAQWFRVFPRNPIARGIGTFALGIVVALACIYHLRVYFVALPQASNTPTLYSKHEPHK